MSKINLDKQNGQTLSGPEVMIVVNAVNALYDMIANGGILPGNFFLQQNGKTVLNPDYLIAAKISSTWAYQPTRVVNGVTIYDDILPLDAYWDAKIDARIALYNGGAVELAAAAIVLGQVSQNSIGFSWQAIPNAATYDVYRGGVKIANTANINYNSTGLTASTLYQHYVRAVPAAGANYKTGPASNTLTASTATATGLPTPTAPIVLFDASARTLSAKHANYPNGLEKRYNGGSWEAWVDTAAVYVGTDAVNANSYEWRVKAVAQVNNSGTPAGNTAIEAQIVAPAFTKVPAPIVNNFKDLVYSAAEPKIIAMADMQNVVAKWGIYFITGQDTNPVFIARGHRMGFAFEDKAQPYLNQNKVNFNYNPNNGKVEVSVGNAGETLVQDFYGDPYFRLTARKETSDIFFEWSADGITYTGGKALPIANGMVLHLRINSYGLTAGDFLSLMQYSGMLIDNSVS